LGGHLSSWMREPTYIVNSSYYFKDEAFMIFLISPAKSLDFDSASLTDEYSIPRMLEESEQLVGVMRSFDWEGISKLMKVSENISKLNVQRFLDWEQPFNSQNAKQAVFAFNGDVYGGLAVETMEPAQIDYIQSSVRILSGLYGLLKPLDLMQAYRLEMGSKVENSIGKNLYDFWGDKITDLLNVDLSSEDSSTVVNLASNEYYKSVKTKGVKAKIVTPVFKDEKNGQYKIISFYAKKARGLMVRYAADNLIRDSEGLKEFNYGGYAYCHESSSEIEWVFRRKEIKK